MRITLTVFFEPPFYVGVFERQEGECISAAKVIFGAEPSDPEVCAWVLEHFHTLRFSPFVNGAKEVKIPDNPKRRQREAARATSDGIGTKSQKALQLAREEAKQERKIRTKQERECEEERRLQLRIEKKKAKHRGH